MDSTTFKCECGKAEGWIAKDRITIPCPVCGRRYEGHEKRDSRGITVIFVKEIKEAAAKHKQAKAGKE